MKFKISIRETLKKYKRVLRVARKPTRDELKETVRICGLGFLIVGMIGFFFYLISILATGV